MKKLLLFGALLFWLNGLIAQTNFINQDSVFARTANCDAGVAVCIDSFAYDSITSLRFYLDGRQFSGTFTACSIDTIQNYAYTDIFRGLERGPWRLDSMLINGQTYTGNFTSLKVLLDSMRLWDPVDNWQLDSTAKTIFGNAKKSISQYGCQYITGLGRGGRNVVCHTTGIEFKGLRFSVPAGVREFVVEKTRTGMRDTVILVAACVSPDTVRKTINLGSGQNYCFNTTQLLGTPGNLVNLCSSATTHTLFDAPASGCIRYVGASVGTDTACLKVCDSYGICDTTILIVTAVNPPTRTTIIEDTITIGLTRTNAGVVVPIGTTTAFENICATNSGTNVAFTLFETAHSVSYQGLTAGVDTACIRVCNALNICDTTIYHIRAIPAVVQPRVTQHIFKDTITVGLLARSKCSFDGPSGTPTLFENFCPQNSGSNVRFSIDTATKCIKYSGIVKGIDTACIRICNAARKCDTTYMYVEVLQAPINNRRIHEFRDTITVGLNRDKCDIIEPTTPTHIHNLCEGQSGSNVDFLVNATTRCVNYMGVTPGIDTACIEICNASGLCDTTYMYITTLNPQTLRGRFLTDSITVKVGETKRFCADSSRVGASFFRSFYNTSPLYSSINPKPNACMDITGGIVGRDTVYMVLNSNDNGIKDTTRLFIVVVPEVVRPTPSVDSISLKIFETKTYCPDSSELRGSPIRYIAFCSTASFDNIYQPVLDTVRKCVTIRGKSTGQDTLCLVLTNEAGFMDTTTLYVNVSRDTVVPTIKLDSVKVFVGDSLTYCGIDTTEIRGAVDSISNYCAQKSGLNSTVEITASKCLKIKGLKVGVDTACIVVCNRLSRLCDTTRVKIIVSIKPTVNPTASIDSITVSVGQSKNYCPDTTQLSGSAINSIRFCTPPNADNATITLDNVTKCVKIVGNTEGRDTVCVLVCNTAGTCDTTTLYVKVTPRDSSKPVSNTVLIAIDLNKDTSFCGVDSLQIRGAVDTIYDACSGKNGLHALMVLDTDTKCVKITGRAIGKDTMCLVVHNNASGLYDTTFVIANVRDPRGLKVIAVDDFDTLRRGRQKELLVYQNDTLSRTPTSLVITRPPVKGKADTISFQRGIIQYTASRAPSACGLDSFRYKVCIDSTCSEATVIVLVVCSDSLVVYNGISPNGDSKNQTWLIDGLQAYPNHTVCVFNRWGTEVMKTKDYKNDWDGKWNGKDLPDGTYFYWIREDDKGEILKTGYLQILR